MEWHPLLPTLCRAWKQTSLRAEIAAAISALKRCASITKPGRLWIDKQQVFDVLTAWLQGFDPPLHKKQDADMWVLLRDQFRLQAHAEGNNQPTPVDEWAVRGNEAADQCAPDASQHFPTQLLVLHARLTQELRTLREHGKAWHNVLLAIDAPAPEKAQPSHVVDLDLGLRCVAGALVSDFPKKFRINELQYVLDWLPTLVSDSVPVVWVSFHQLLIDYQFTAMGTFQYGPEMDRSESR